MRRPALRMSPNARMLSQLKGVGGELDTVKDANQLFLDGNASG